MVDIADDEFLYFVRSAVDDMVRIVAELGDELACTKPDIPGANTAFALLTHCLGVIEYWAGQVNLGRAAHRDRAAEFTACGRVDELIARTERVLAQFAEDVAAAGALAEPASSVDAWARKHERPFSPGGVLLHVYEECAQHLGQLEVIRDALQASAGPAPYDPPLGWLRRKRTVKWTRPGPERIPAWVADMDFPVAPPIRAAILGMLDRGDLGYPDWSLDPLAEAFAHRMRHSFGWAADPARVRPLNDLIQGVQVVLHLATVPGDRVLVQLPNYPPFRNAIPTMGRELVPVPLVPDGESWTWDHDRLRRDAAGARVLLLVNPQNPTGRAFTRAELQRLADVAVAEDLLVICDEIHAELVHAPHQHVPFATLAPERTVTLTSATKAYNIAGVRTAVAHVGPQWLRQRWAEQPPDLFGIPNTIGVEATVTAWRECDAWLAGLREHLRGQRDHLAARVATDLPGVRMRLPDAGYLAWLDCRDLGLPEDPAAWFRERARVELAPGPDYGPDARGRVRLNFATSRAVLDEIIDRMAAALPR
jgi:bifunctional pyridoxal-dependent enzyme with beta-cystathionase and maltose regulon repressor activities